MSFQSKRTFCLVVSDAPYPGDSLPTFLSSHGCESEIVEGFDRGFARYQASNPDLIVVDCRRQKFEALVFVKRVRWRTDKSKIPIFCVSDDEKPTLVEHLLFKSDDVFLVKSLSPEFLSDVFRMSKQEKIRT